MKAEHARILKPLMSGESWRKLDLLDNDAVTDFIARSAALCLPDSIWVGDDSEEDDAYVRRLALERGEEKPLAIRGHTVHFDGYYDQARRRRVTKYLVPEGRDLDPGLNQMPRDEGIREMDDLQRGAYRGRTMLVRFFCLGPTESVFAIPCLQVTDSAYVLHSEDLLYRKGYAEFVRQGGEAEFFRFRHATGEVDGRMTSRNSDLNRVYVDYTQDTVYSVNTQYAGNAVGLKKLALRLALRRADREGWLAEHMFIMRCNGPGGRRTYFCGAYPSGCGKTSTAMTPGENVVGDDLAYFRVIEGAVRAASVEKGIFGIITDVNAHDDPVIYEVLHRPGEVIFSNVLVRDGRPYWLGMGEEMPSAGESYVSGNWKKGMAGPDGKEAEPSHRNARYTLEIESLKNVDPEWDRPDGLPVSGIIYGGRDSDTSVPVREAYSWAHGICTIGATIESETTAATAGEIGLRRWNLMSNIDFLSFSFGRYIRNNLEFGRGIARPKVFGTNYFLKKDGVFLNDKLDKDIWLKWMELRVHGEAEALDGACGMIPLYPDLQRLFREILKKHYSKESYAEQFTIRIPEWLAKIERMEKIFAGIADLPQPVREELSAQRDRLEALRAARGDCVNPLDLES